MRIVWSIITSIILRPKSAHRHCTDAEFASEIMQIHELLMNTSHQPFSRLMALARLKALALKCKNDPAIKSNCKLLSSFRLLSKMFNNYIDDVEIRSSIVAIYNHLDLWRAEDLSTVCCLLSSTRTVDEVWEEVAAILPHLSKEEREFISDGLRLFPKQTTALYLLLKAQTIQSEELKDLLQATAKNFANILQLRDWVDDGLLHESRQSDKRLALIVEGLAQIMRDIKNHKESAQKAILQARSNALSLVAKELSDYHLQFYDLVQNGQLDWKDHRTWNAAEVVKENLLKQSREKQLILVDFRGRRRLLEESLVQVESSLHL